MDDKKSREAVLKALKEVWELNPTLRFGQLIALIMGEMQAYMTDAYFLHLLQEEKERKKQQEEEAILRELKENEKENAKSHILGR